MKRYGKVKSILKRTIKRDIKPNQIDQAKDSSIFSTILKENEDKLKKVVGINDDVIFHKFVINSQNEYSLNALLITVSGIIHDDIIRNNILLPLIEKPLDIPIQNVEQIKERLSVKKIKTTDSFDTGIFQVMKGYTLLLFDGYSEGLLIETSAYESRSIQEPSSEQSVRGARDGFVESAATNISLIRQRIPHPSLQFESFDIGQYSQTRVTVGYINDITDSKLVERIRDRLNKIKVDAINNSGEIEQFIEDHPYSIFSTIGNTERPDKASALLMEGRIIILIDGNPVSLYFPSLFLETIKNIEDYNSRPYYGSFIRILRLIAFIISFSLPALYISALNFHKEVIPSDLVVKIIQAREAVPFPLALEIVLMVLMFEVVREAGIRLPQQIGSALSIVGALILGEVSVTAGLVGAPTIVIVSLSYITSFIIIPVADVTSLLRMGFILASSLFGAYGLFMGFLGLITHMVSLTSLGVPYMAPFAPVYFRDWKDSFFHLPLRLIRQRPESIPNQRTTKIKSLPKIEDK